MIHLDSAVDLSMLLAVLCEQIWLLSCSHFNVLGCAAQLLPQSHHHVFTTCFCCQAFQLFPENTLFAHCKCLVDVAYTTTAVAAIVFFFIWAS